MAATHGRASPALSERLKREPYEFDFFQAVRILEQLAQGGGGLSRAAIGGDVAPEHEFVRFRALVGQGFPAAPLTLLRDSTSGGPREASVSFFGLMGPLGVLPQHYTSLLLQRVRAKDFALRDFLDLFNHRALSLFVRAWEKYRLPFTYERAVRDSATDSITQAIYCLSGFGTKGLRGRTRVPDTAFLFYAGHFAHFPRSATALEGLLADYFGLPVRVDQAAGQWLSLDAADASCLPNDDFPDGRNNELGLSLIIGERVWDVQGKFRVRLGPLHYEQFRDFMPDGAGLRELVDLVRSYVGPEFDFDIVPLLVPTEAPACELLDGDAAPRLGWNAWVHDGDYVHVIADAVFAATAVEGA